ncbi:MAG: NTP transferase domain-containing protein [Cryobacterium sp.]|nr:NTP transferase domain-containing protein [Cryobacterium sp.]MCO5293316.1 NTP transferase domain-containing protein [Homoserinimonas sp.]MCW5945208.1 NTP transferase domain-containing protein [Cryobacterium sp.]
MKGKFDAIVLAGGKSSRLGSVAKTDLRFNGLSLLENTLKALSGADRVVVVGPEDLPVPERILLTRESPPFSGPVAAIVAGARLLEREDGSEIVVILACDMPHLAPLIPLLTDRLGRSSGEEAVVAVDPGGRRQHLAGAIRAEVLSKRIAELPDGGRDLPVSRIYAGLQIGELEISGSETDDVDTWEDAARLGVTDSE